MSSGAEWTVHGEQVLLAEGFAAANVTVRGGRIEAVVRGAPAPGAASLPSGAMLAPGLIDVQVNGGGGVLFNDAPNPSAIRTMVAAHRAGGTTGLLPTLITGAPPLIAAAAVREARATPGSGVLGLHLEGPFISQARPGVHAPQWIRRMMDDDVLGLLAIAADCPLLLTLAPETVSDAMLQALAAGGVVLSAGHTEASAARLASARASGLRGYTHLWNAMPSLAGRAPGPVGACLADETAWCGLIADGVHVDPVNLRLAMRCKPARVLLVSDAMPVAGTTLDGFTLQGRWIERRDGRLLTEDGTLAGADLSMIGAVRNATSLGGASLEDALRMGSTVPADFLGLPERGRIEVGGFADLLVLSDRLEVIGTCVEGGWTAGQGSALVPLGPAAPDPV